MAWKHPTTSTHRRRWLHVGPYTILGFFFVCYFIAPIQLDALFPSADVSQNKCPLERANDPIKTSRPNSGIVKVISLTNAGAFVDRCQYTDALYELVWDRLPIGAFGPPRKADAKTLPRFTILYVHGWKHGSEAADSDLMAFQDLVRRLADTNLDRQVLGIYVAWNAAWGLGVVDNLSFWSKKLIADRIAQSAALTKIIAAIGASRMQRGGASDQFIAIGHSFGARQLFSAVGQILLYETQKVHPGFPGGQYELVKGPTDAVILLNPAFEASLFTAFNGVSRAEEKFSPDQAPLVISIATDADDATRYAFPVGQWLYGMGDDKELTTLGNYEQFFTHRLTFAQPGTCDAAGRSPISEQFEAGGICLHRADFGHNRIVHKHNPFIVARTGGDVISGHSDIWNPTFSNWLFRLIDQLRTKHETSDAKR